MKKYTKDDIKEFHTAAKPLVNYLRKNHDPQTTAIISQQWIEIVEGVIGTQPIDIRDEKE